MRILIRCSGPDPGCGALIRSVAPALSRGALIRPIDPDLSCGALIRLAGPILRGPGSFCGSKDMLIRGGGAKYMLAPGNGPLEGAWPECPLPLGPPLLSYEIFLFVSIDMYNRGWKIFHEVSIDTYLPSPL